MAFNETTVTVVGTVLDEVTLGRDGTDDVVGFRVRSIERRFDKAAEAWVDGRGLTVAVRCKRRLVIGVLSTLHRNDPVIVTGRLSSVDENGEARSVPEVEALAVGPNLAQCAATVHRIRRHEPGPSPGHARARDSGAEAEKPVVGAPEPVPVG